MTANYLQTGQIFLSLVGNGMINFLMLFICALLLLFHLLSNPRENPVSEADPKALSPLVLLFQPLLSCMRQSYGPKKYRGVKRNPLM